MQGLIVLWAGVILWSFVAFTPCTKAQAKRGQYLSEKDVLLFKDEPSPKCLARTLDGLSEQEFTCFFTTKHNSSFDFYYTVDNPPRRTRCELHVQRSDDGGFLHVCSFPRSDIFMFEEIPLQVLDRTQNSSLYSRTVTVEDNILLEPPSNILLSQNGHVGELQVSWEAKCDFTLFYKIRYSSKSRNQTIKQGHNKLMETLSGLAPGEAAEVQVSVRCAPSRRSGHWSRWSAPARAVAPQAADDISLTCHTEDLLSVTCEWDNGNVVPGYTLFYRTSSSDGQGWTQWTECFPQTNVTDRCGFHGNAHKRLRVKLSHPRAPLNRTFYSEDFKLGSIVKTRPPSHLKQNGTEDLCVSWDPPVSALSSHLQYELNYRPSTEEHWMTVSSNGPETAVCLKPPWSSQFDVKVRAKPSGAVYSGQWSNWSEVLTTDAVPSSSRIMLLSQWSPILILVFAVLFLLLFSKYFKKLKQYIWPSVPNLDKVLQDFLTDFKQHKWDTPVAVKQVYGETTASVVEVLSKDGSGLDEACEKSVGLLSSSDTSYSSMGQEDDSIDVELYPDYVALNKNMIILCTKENSYIYEDRAPNKEKHENAKQNSPKSSEGEQCLGSDFLNRSYLFLATDHMGSKEREQRGQGNIYTNMPCN